MKKRRADERLLNELGLESVELARALIMAGRAFIGDRKIMSPAEPVADDESVRVRGEIERYASRGAHKLKRALEAFQIDVRDRVCLDVGASTGGFTDVLLRAGARRVYAVDVGKGLLHYKLRGDPRVVLTLLTDHDAVRPGQALQRCSSA